VPDFRGNHTKSSRTCGSSSVALTDEIANWSMVLNSTKTHTNRIYSQCKHLWFIFTDVDRKLYRLDIILYRLSLISLIFYLYKIISITGKISIFWHERLACWLIGRSWRRNERTALEYDTTECLPRGPDNTDVSVTYYHTVKIIILGHQKIQRLVRN